MFRVVTITIILATAGLLPAGEQPITVRPDLSQAEGIAQWTLDGSGTWDIGNGALRLTKAGTPAGAIRRPSALAILRSDPFTTVAVEADMKSTQRVDVPLRDVDIIFGYESPTRFYYVHLAGVTNEVHNGIFLVADADRRRLDEATSQPLMRDQAWHHVRLERDPATGRIEVFVNGSKDPVLKAVDTTIRAGRVGFGSFDDTGEFRNIVISGTTK